MDNEGVTTPVVQVKQNQTLTWLIDSAYSDINTRRDCSR
jgi:hypothetical protein